MISGLSDIGSDKESDKGSDKESGIGLKGLVHGIEFTLGPLDQSFQAVEHPFSGRTFNDLTGIFQSLRANVSAAAFQAVSSTSQHFHLSRLERVANIQVLTRGLADESPRLLHRPDDKEFPESTSR